MNDRPTIVSFQIDASETTTSPNVTLNNACTGVLTDYMASEAVDFAGASWQPYSATPSFAAVAGQRREDRLSQGPECHGRVDGRQRRDRTQRRYYGEDDCAAGRRAAGNGVWCPPGTFMMGPGSWWYGDGTFRREGDVVAGVLDGQVRTDAAGSGRPS